MKPLSVTAPLLLLVYGLLRWIDGLNGRRHDGVAWNLGHTAFFIGMALFAVLAVLLVRVAAPSTGGRRALAAVAASATVLGVGCFLWVITGDLFPGFDVELPAPLSTGGPALFGLGMVVLMGLLVAARRLPVWSPVLFFAGFVSIAFSLDLLPIAATVILFAFAPLAAPSAARQIQ
jgi:hypothetical protein